MAQARGTHTSAPTQYTSCIDLAYVKNITWPDSAPQGFTALTRWSNAMDVIVYK